MKRKKIKLPAKKALTDYDILHYVHKYKIKNFRGVFDRDNLPKKPYKYESGVVNLDSKYGVGTHWTAYTKFENDIIYFDSFGDLLAPKELINYFKNCNIYYNKERYQHFNSNICGQLCIKFLLKTTNLI